MRVKAKFPTSTAGPVGSSTCDKGGYKDTSGGGPQPPSMGPEPGTVDIPIGSLVYYYAVDPAPEDIALVIDRKECPIADVIDQANPDCWHPRVNLLLIMYLDPRARRWSSGTRWRPQRKDWLAHPPGLWNSYWPPGPGWVLERGSHLPGQELGPLLWRLIE
jgi:hypothetical protein